MYIPATTSAPSFRLAPHETLQLHEMLAYKTVGLVKLKMNAGLVENPELRQMYLQTIGRTEQEVCELAALLENRALLPG